jgi:hypothetical protein
MPGIKAKHLRDFPMDSVTLLIITGIMVDYKNLFSLAEWKNGVIDGNCLVVFGDSKIFYGQIKNKNAVGICTYHLKDKSQIFCNFKQSTTAKSS